MFLQKADDFFQHGSFVHFASVAWKHGAELLDENIELIAPLLLRLVTRSPVDRGKETKGEQTENESDCVPALCNLYT